MANMVRVRVELRNKYNDSMRNFREMLHAFRRQVGAAGVLHDCKAHQNYESESETTRKQGRESLKRIQAETIKKKIIAGDPIYGPPGLIKKVRADMIKEQQKAQKRKERRRDNGGD